eukprot:SAG31_NODE_36877_length_309_cov_0.985714_1_plen_102_part_11
MKLAKALREHGLATMDEDRAGVDGIESAQSIPNGRVDGKHDKATLSRVNNYLECIKHDKARHWWSTFIGARTASHNAVADALGRWLELQNMLSAEAAIVAAT